MSRLHQIRAYFHYWLHVVDEHSIHSPFFFDFYQKVIRYNPTAPNHKAVEALRGSVLVNNMLVAGREPGAGTLTSKKENRTIKDIARHSITPARYSRFYQRLIDYNEMKYIVELGTSIGINTLYLSANPEVRVFTFEGHPVICGIALTHFEAFERQNVFLVEGNIDQTLPDFLQGTTKLQLVLMDANHTYEATLLYFSWLLKRLNEKSIVVVDDIHWSAGMESAWSALKKNELVYGSIDLYRCGILFFDPALNRQHFTFALPSK